MTVADNYRSKAARLRAEAQRTFDVIRRKELEALANAYLRLAAQADRNSQNDVIYEPPLRNGDDRQD